MDMFGHYHICPKIDRKLLPGVGQTDDKALAGSLAVEKLKTLVTGKSKFASMSEFVDPLATLSKVGSTC